LMQKGFLLPNFSKLKTSIGLENRENLQLLGQALLTEINSGKSGDCQIIIIFENIHNARDETKPWLFAFINQMHDHNNKILLIVTSKEETVATDLPSSMMVHPLRCYSVQDMTVYFQKRYGCSNEKATYEAEKYCDLSSGNPLTILNRLRRDEAKFSIIIET